MRFTQGNIRCRVRYCYHCLDVFESRYAEREIRSATDVDHVYLGEIREVGRKEKVAKKTGLTMIKWLRVSLVQRRVTYEMQ